MIMNLLYGSNRLYFGSKLTCISVDQNRYLFFIIFFLAQTFSFYSYLQPHKLLWPYVLFLHKNLWPYDLNIIKNVDKVVISQNFKNARNQSTIQTMLRMLRLCHKYHILYLVKFEWKWSKCIDLRRKIEIKKTSNLIMRNEIILVL